MISPLILDMFMAYRKRGNKQESDKGSNHSFGGHRLYRTLMTFGIILLVGTVIFYLLALTTLNLNSSPSSPVLQSLIDVIKSLGTILGIALATIIAFYFGIRGSETAAEKVAADVSKKAKKSDEDSSPPDVEVKSPDDGSSGSVDSSIKAVFNKNMNSKTINNTVVRSPLTIIAIFVALIEAFLSYPVTQLQGIERMIIVLFMTSFPFFVAFFFFYILWHKPSHLYNPQEIPQEIQSRYQAKVVESTAVEIKMREIQEQMENLTISQMKNMPVYQPLKSDIQNRALQYDLELIESEVRSKIQTVGKADESTIEEVKNEVHKKRKQAKSGKVTGIQQDMLKFKDWLGTIGFIDLPDLPKILESELGVISMYEVSTDSARIDMSFLEDPSVRIFPYIVKIVVKKFGSSTLGKQELALYTGFNDYFVCAYLNDPFSFRKSIQKMGMESDTSYSFKRNLEDVVSFDSNDDNYKMSLVWSGACWELRQLHGNQAVDMAVCFTLSKLPEGPKIKDAAQILLDELALVSREDIKKEIIDVFNKRGIKVTP
jgi:hypothetical protein